MKDLKTIYKENYRFNLPQISRHNFNLYPKAYGFLVIVENDYKINNFWVVNNKETVFSHKKNGLKDNEKLVFIRNTYSYTTNIYGLNFSHIKFLKFIFDNLNIDARKDKINNFINQYE